MEFSRKIYEAIESEANNFMLLNCSFLNKKCNIFSKTNEVHHDVRKIFRIKKEIDKNCLQTRPKYYYINAE